MNHNLIGYFKFITRITIYVYKKLVIINNEWFEMKYGWSISMDDPYEVWMITSVYLQEWVSIPNFFILVEKVI